MRSKPFARSPSWLPGRPLLLRRGPGQEPGKAFLSIRPMDRTTQQDPRRPEFAGRLTGHEGYGRRPMGRREIPGVGLKPLSAREGYLQAYPSPYTVIDKAEALRLGAGRQRQDKSFTEIGCSRKKSSCPCSSRQRRKTAASSSRAGISAPGSITTVRGARCQDKFVLCFRGTPDHADARFQSHDEHRARMKTAKDKGAAGLIYIYPEPASNPNGDRLPGFLPAQVSEKVADALFKGIR